MRLDVDRWKNRCEIETTIISEINVKYNKLLDFVKKEARITWNEDQLEMLKDCGRELYNKVIRCRELLKEIGEGEK